MSGAILNLVRLNTADETAPEHDYTAGEIFERHEEIQLVDPDGCPCAIPSPASFSNMDYRYAFITGDMGHQARQIKRDLSIAIDYVLNDKARKMEHWMHQRARVLFSPDMGRNTMFMFRPIGINGTKYRGLDEYAYDMTGNQRIWCVSTADPSLMWDRIKRRFIQKPEYHDGAFVYYGYARHHHTPGGGGHAFPMAVRNLQVPSSPESATPGPGAGNSGWHLSGVDAATQLTLSHDATAFGHPECPGVLRVEYTDDVSSARSLAISPAFDPGDGYYQGITPTGAGTMPVCVWVRGQFPDSSALELTGNTGTTTRDLSGMRLDGWTPIFVSRKETDWGASVPVVRLTLESVAGTSGAIEIGPTMICQAAGIEYPAGEYWAPSQSTTYRANIQTIDDFVFPDQGTIVSSFYLPEWWFEDYADNTRIGICGNNDWGLSVGHLAGSADFITVSETGGGSTNVYVVGLKAGQINTIAYSWGGGHKRLYVNGVAVGDVSPYGTDITFGGNDSPLRIGLDHDVNSMFPGVMLTLRIDEGSMTDEEVANNHLALTDPIALQSAMNARGRVYQITGIPQTVRSSAGGSHVLGVLKLQQVELQNWLTDPLNKEESVL